MGRQKGYFITEQILKEYKIHLVMEEKSKATISKYICDIKKLAEYASGRSITKELVVAYKEDLRTKKNYKLSSINSFLAAANRLFEYLGWYGLHVKTYRIQKEAFTPAGKDLSKAEYKKMVQAALQNGVIFRTKNGSLVNRSNFCKDLRKTCIMAGIDENTGSIQHVKNVVIDGYPYYILKN